MSKDLGNDKIEIIERGEEFWIEKRIVELKRRKILLWEIGNERKNIEKRKKKEEMNVIIGGRKRIIGIGNWIMNKKNGWGMKVVEEIIKIFGEEGEILILEIGLEEIEKLIEEGSDGEEKVKRKIKEEEVERMNEVRKLIDNGNERIEKIMDNEMLLDIEMEEEKMMRNEGMLKKIVCKKEIKKRSKKEEKIIGRMKLGIVKREMRNIGMKRNKKDKRKKGIVEREDINEVEEDIGMEDDRIGFILRR